MNVIRFFKRYTTFKTIYQLENVMNSLRQLAFFLREEVDCFGSLSWIQFLNKHDEDSTSGNLMTLYKKGNNIYIGNIHYNGPEEEQAYCVIAASELIKVMKQWEELMQQKPEEITLSEANGKIELVGKNQ